MPKKKKQKKKTKKKNKKKKSGGEENFLCHIFTMGALWNIIQISEGLQLLFFECFYVIFRCNVKMGWQYCMIRSDVRS